MFPMFGFGGVITRKKGLEHRDAAIFFCVPMFEAKSGVITRTPIIEADFCCLGRKQFFGRYMQGLF